MAFEIVSDLLVTVVKFVWGVLILGVLEFFVQGLGYLICRLFSRNVKRDSWLVALVGIMFWALVILAIAQINAVLDVDKCLDSGGKFNYESSRCIFIEDVSN